MRFVNSAFLFLMLSGSAAAQTTSALHVSDYVGAYADAPGHTLEIVDGDGLFAVVDERKYRLHASGVDQFTTMSGDTVRFPRDVKGKVTGYEQDGKFHPRVSTTVTPESAALARPRPKGQDSPSDYRCHTPANMHEGLAVGNIVRSDLGVATADAIVRGILDRTFQDVHSVLLYQRGNLVMEEYFYGYTVQRQHQLRSATKSVVSALAGIALPEFADANLFGPLGISRADWTWNYDLTNADKTRRAR